MNYLNYYLIAAFTVVVKNNHFYILKNNPFDCLKIKYIAYISLYLNLINGSN